MPLTEKDRNLLIRLDDKIDNLESTVSELKRDLKDQYVTKIEFSPVQRAVYAAIGFILTGFMGAILTLVLRVH